MLQAAVTNCNNQSSMRMERHSPGWTWWRRGAYPMPVVRGWDPIQAYPEAESEERAKILGTYIPCRRNEGLTIAPSRGRSVPEEQYSTRISIPCDITQSALTVSATWMNSGCTNAELLTTCEVIEEEDPKKVMKWTLKHVVGAEEEAAS